MPRSLTDKQKVLALTFYEAEKEYQIDRRETKEFNKYISRNKKKDARTVKYFNGQIFRWSKLPMPKHDYYDYFSSLRIHNKYNIVQDKFYHNLINSISMGVWYDVAKQKGFQKVVKIKTIERYKKIDKDKPCIFDEDDAREFYRYFFQEEISKYNQPTKVIQKIVGNKVAKELAEDNWQYDYTQIVSITFDMDTIRQIQAENPDIAACVKEAKKEAVNNLCMTFDYSFNKSEQENIENVRESINLYNKIRDVVMSEQAIAKTVQEIILSIKFLNELENIFLME
jgi:hypothetical protein